MLAAVFHAPNNIVVQQVPIRRRKAMLKVNACAVCGYDARVFRNGHRKVRPPVILGHELCGEIQNEIIAGDGLTTINAGSRVAVCPLVPCLQCPYCKIGDYNLCVDLREIGSTSDGGFAQYITIPDQLVRIGGLVPVPDNLTDEEAALLEPLACCLNSYYRMLPIAKESSIVIIGDGPMGLLHLQLFKRLLSSSRVAIVGKVPLRMEKARAMGADAVFAYSRETVPDVLNFAGDSSSSSGAEVIVIATSNPVAFELATKVSARNSKINIFAGMPGGQTFLLDANWLHYNQISITGTFSSTPKMLREATRIASEKTIDLSSIVTHTYSLPEIEEAIEVTEKYHGLR
ncbi:MAG TPA: alcohol dehydrogenase catalytic domain-containing protein, partial [Nitrososphaera sp.]|nr:alcohol dehydrogenase catalytic domain-containing protein [Nitrososphaera sp.]